MRKALTYVCIFFLVNAGSLTATTSSTTSTITELLSSTRPVTTWSGTVASTIEEQTNSSTTTSQMTAESTSTSLEPHVTGVTTPTSSESLVINVTVTTSTPTSNDPLVSNLTTTALLTYPVTDSTTTIPTIEIQPNSTSTMTTYTSANSTTSSRTTYPTTSSTIYPTTNSTLTFSITYPETNFTTSLYEAQTNSTVLSTDTLSTTYPITNSTATSTTYPTTDLTTTSTTTTNDISSYSTTYPATNSTATSTTYPTTNSTTTSTTTTNDISSYSTTYPATNSTATSTTYPTTNSTTTSTTTNTTTNDISSYSTTYPATNSTAASTTYPTTNSTTTSTTTTNDISSYSTTYPATNSTAASTTYPTTNSTTTSTTTNTTTNNISSYSTTYPATNSTATSTTYPTTNSTTTSTTTNTTNDISSYSTTYPATNSTATSTTYPTTNSTATSTTYPTTNSTSTASTTTNTTTNYTNSTATSTTYSITNSTTTPTTSYRITNSTTSASISTTTASVLEVFVYGTNHGDSVFTNIDDACYPEVTSSLQFPVYGILYSTMYICSNGIVSFDERITTPGPPWDDIGLQSQGSYLAPYFNDLDFRQYGSSGAGAIYYHAYDIIENNSLRNNSNVIKARNYVRKYETDQGTFNPTFLLVVTWAGASPYPISYRPTERVTFQLALVTDGLNTFVVYIYVPGQMRFNYNYVFIGYSFANSGVLKKDMNSFTTGALRMDSNAVTNGIRGLLYYRLTPVGFQVSSEERVCRAWWSENRYWTWYNWWMNAIMPRCPCTLNLLWWDSSFGNYYFDGPNIYCAVVQPRWWYSPHGKTCCYDLRTGQYQQTAPNAGGFLQYHKALYPRQYQAVDQRMKEYCCSKTNLCHLYYDLRPVSWCYSRFPFFFAFFWGDPHIETLDKKKFTFNGWGEYTLVSLNTTNTTFTLQSRTARAMKADGNYTDATIFSAFAAKDNVGANIHVELNQTKDGLIIYKKSNENASSFDDLTTDFADMSREFNVLDEYLSLSRDDASKTFTAVFSSGISLNISVGVQMLSVGVVLPTEFKEQPKGLLGNFDGNPDNDFRCPNGTQLASNITEREIFNYGQTWEVTGSESVFRYPLGKNHSDFQHSNFIPKFLDEADQAKVNKSKQKCGEDNQECIFDLVFTENEAVANNTLNIESRVANGQSEIGNVVPSISGNGTVYAYNASRVMVNINGSDDGNITFKFLQNTANASFMFNVNDTKSAVLSFFLDNLNPVSISVTVEDNHGVQAPALELTILMCSGCSDHGSCNFTQERRDNRSTTHFKYVTCNCSPYWEGDDCERDFDGCATRPCSSLRSCIDNPADVHLLLNRTYNCSSCPNGYTDGVEDPAKCIDVNECNATNATHGCNQTCINTEGSYNCSCNSTFRLHSNGKDCQDIDECLEGTSGCDQECNNTYGGYICGCKIGYIYNNTIQKCVQANATICPTKNCTGAHGCTRNETNHEVCFCRSGYQLNATDLCEDVNECQQRICFQVCENVDGGFRCKCNKGYTLASDKISCISCTPPNYGENCSSTCTCGRGAIRCDPLSGCVCESGWTGTNCDQDVNECSQNPNICNSTLKTCLNTMGSYTCNCVPGYQASNNTCTDINECGDPTLNTCEQICVNTLGGFSCGCQSGYNTDPGNSTKCIDINECTAGQSGCQQVCENSPGRFSCSCYFGYALTVDRKTCTQVDDPCKTYGNITCDQICLVDYQANTASCSCNLGFKLAANNRTCDDINECIGDGSLINCSSNGACRNTNGSYVCSCRIGYKLENDGRTCSECDSFHYGINCSTDCNCSVGADRCDKESGCLCKIGWSGTKCDTDINECSDKTLCTGANMYCLNTQGSYQCVCGSGYNKIDGSCIDIDECSTQNVCAYNCTNTNGSYQCSCQPGYKVNGAYCPDIDECLRGEDNCSQGCQNTEGSYKCVCYTGFELNGTTCTPLPGHNMTSTDLTFTFDIQITGNLSDINTYDQYLYDVNQTLYNYFKRKMGSYFISIEKISLSKGSLIAVFVLLMQDSATVDDLLVTYLTDALNEQFVLGGVNVSLQSLGVGGNTGLCAVYENIVGTCPSGYKCTVSGGRPSCGPDKKEDNLPLIIGLSVGLPLGALLIAVVIVLVLKAKNNKIKDLAICGGRWPKREVLYPIGENRKQSGHSRSLHGLDENNLEFESDENEATNGMHGKQWPLSKADV